MKQLICTLLTILMGMSYASSQEIKHIDMDYIGGKLGFDYYEKDGVKVPHGPMTFNDDQRNWPSGTLKVTESGNCKDGYRDGEWHMSLKTPYERTEKVFNYKNGLLDGDVIIKRYKTNTKTKRETLKSNVTYHFKNGHPFGKNKYFHNSDTIYFEHNELGYCVGEWKLINKNGSMEIDVYDQDGEYIEHYKVDILGNKEKSEFLGFPGTMHDYIFFGEEITTNGLYVSRYDLPTLCKVKFGFDNERKKKEKPLW